VTLAAVESAVESASGVIEGSVVSVCDFAGGSCDTMSSLGALSPEAKELAEQAQEATSGIIESVAQTKGLLLGAVDDLKADIAGAFPSTQGLDIGLGELPLPDASQLPTDFFQKLTQLQSAIPSAAATMAASVATSIPLLEASLETVTESLSFSLNIQGASTCPAVLKVAQSLPAGLSDRLDTIVSFPDTGSLGAESIQKALGAAGGMKDTADLAKQNADLAFNAAKLQIDAALNKAPGVGDII